MGWEPGISVDEEPPNLASVLSENGYTTGLAGKWHQGIEADIESVAPDAGGRDPEIEDVLVENYERNVSEIKSRGFDEVKSLYARNVFAIELPEEMQHHNMDWVTQGALEFIEEQQDDPFYLHLAPTIPHDPWEMEQLQSDPRSTPRGYLDEPPDVQPSREDVVERVEQSDRTSSEPSDDELPSFMTRSEVQMGRMFATWLDDGVGAVLDKLDELGIADNTLVIFTSDHGNKGKLTCYDAGARQPCIARWPGVTEPGSQCDQLVSNVDLAPTIFDVTGVDPGPEYSVDGQSFAPLLTGEGDYDRESVLLEITTERAVVTDDGFKYLAVRYPPEIQQNVDERQLYSHWCVPFDNDGAHHTYGAEEDYPAYFDQDQLYDLTEDPGEQHNLCDDPRYADRLAEMQELLRGYSETLPHEFGEFT